MAVTFERHPKVLSKRVTRLFPPKNALLLIKVASSVQNWQREKQKKKCRRGWPAIRWLGLITTMMNASLADLKIFIEQKIYVISKTLTWWHVIKQSQASYRRTQHLNICLKISVPTYSTILAKVTGNPTSPHEFHCTVNIGLEIILVLQVEW